MRRFYSIILWLLVWTSYSQAGTAAAGFVENRGQWPDEIYFSHRSEAVQLTLTKEGLHYFLPGPKGAYRLDLKLLGANPLSQPEAIDKLGYHENYVVNQQSTRAHAFRGLRYKQVYEGIDWVIFQDEAGQVKYEFHVAPGANPQLIQFHYAGSEQVLVNTQGELLVRGPHGELREAAPVSWVTETGQAVPSSFKIGKNKRISFELGHYDSKQGLVIDPLVSWLTLVGGNGNYEAVTGVYTDPTTRINYVCGYTNSTNMATTGVHQTTNTDTAGFVAAYNAQGQRLWTTYLGGTNRTELRGIAGKQFVGFELYVTGITTATTGIATNQAFQTVKSGKIDGVVARFNANGGIVWATYFGGNEDDIFNAITDIPSTFNIAVAGSTTTVGGLTTSNTVRPNKTVADGTDGLIVTFNNAGSRLAATYVGGNADEEIRAITSDGTTVYVGGWTTQPSTNYHAVGGFQLTFGGQIDGFVQRLPTSLAFVSWGTYVGGSGWDEVNAIAVTSTRLYIGGRTISTNNISTAGASQTTRFNSFDAFLMQLSPTSGGRVWGTYFGGLGTENIQAISAFPNNTGVAVGGVTTSANLGLNSFQNQLVGTQNAFVSRYSDAGVRLYSSYIGTGNDEAINAISSVNNGEYIIVGGSTNGGNLATPGAHRTQAVGQEGFLATISEPVFEITSFAPGVSAICPGEPFGYRIFLGPQFNVGDTVVVDLVYISGVSRRVDTIVFNQSETLTRFFTLPVGVYPSPARLRPFLLNGLQAGNWFPSNNASQGFPIRERVRIATQPSVPANLSCSPTSVNLSFSIALGSVGPYTVSWLKGDSVVLQTTSITTLSLQGTSSAINGTYRAVISSGCGSDTTNAVVVNVPEPPRFTRQATASREVCLNQRFVLRALSLTSYDSIVFFRGNQRLQGGISDSLVIPNLTTAMAGNYWYRIHNRCGQVNADTVQVSLPPALAFTTQPSGSRTYCVGSPLSITAQLNSSQTGFRWFKNGELVAGATSPQFTFGNLALSDSGRYVLQAFNACDTVTSDTVTIGVANPINFMGPLSGMNELCPGANGSLLQGIQGSIALAQFTWFKNGQPLLSPTTRILNFTNFSAADTGSYVLRMITPCDTLFSDTVRMRLSNTARLLSAPVVRPAYCVGASVNIRLSARNASIQWYKNGQQIPPAQLVVDSALSFTSIAFADTGRYHALLVSGCDTLSTDTFTLNVVNTPIVMSQPQGGTYCLGSQVAAMPTLQNLSSGTYQWFKNQQAVAGANSRTLFFNSFAVTDTGWYRLRISSACDTFFTDSLFLGVLPSVQVTRPLQTPAASCSGFPVQLRFSARFASIQWYRNGQQLIHNGPDSVLTISSADTGWYHAIATGNCGSLSSDTIRIAPLVAPQFVQQPVGGTYCQGTPVTLTTQVQFAGTMTYQWFQNGMPMSTRTNPNLVITAMWGNFNGQFHLRAISSCGDTLYSDTVTLVNIWNPDIVAQSAPVVSVCQGSNTNLQVTTNNATNLSFQWFKNGQLISGANSNQLPINNASVADTGLYRCIVSNQCASDTSDLIRLSLNNRPIITTPPNVSSNCLSGMTSPVVRAQVNGQVQQYRWLVNGQLAQQGTSDSLVLVGGVGAYQVQLIVTGSCGSDTSQVVNIVLSQTFQISFQPSTLIPVCVGSNLPLSVATSGATNLNYQWHFNGQPIVGATAANFNLNNIASSDTGSYYCVIFNSCKRDTTVASRVVLEPSTQIVLQPQSVSNCASTNGTVTLRAGVQGTVFQYQWLVNGNPVGGNADSLVLNTNTPGIRQVQLIVSGGCNNDTSVMATVTVGANTSSNLTASICAGDLYAFFGRQLSVAGNYSATLPNAAGCDSVINLQLTVRPNPVPVISQQGFVLSTDSFVSYQWQLNGTNIPGATQRTYNATANGTYRVLVTDSLQCNGPSADYVVTGVSVRETNPLQWKLYPVPANAYLQIEIHTNQTLVTARLHNSHGQLIAILALENGRNTLDLGHLADGLYFIECEGQVKRFVRQH